MNEILQRSIWDLDIGAVNTIELKNGFGIDTIAELIELSLSEVTEYFSSSENGKCRDVNEAIKQLKDGLLEHGLSLRDDSQAAINE